MRNRTSRPPRFFSAFTLIELLVVIAIIAILAAILFPVFARARENARRSSCMSNERQQALGLKQYAQDYDERLPAAWYYTTLPPWHVLLQPYVKSYQIFRCPSVRRFALSSAYNDGAYYSTYSLPGIGNTAVKKTIYNLDGLHLSEVSEPARTWMIVETGYRGVGDTLYVDSGYGYASPRFDNVPVGGSPEGNANYFIYDLHLDGSNVAFVDGHVKWIKNGDGKNWIFDNSRVP
jgi:prepilin-type N-terminal cleavage/methylation domain-containing protein/prepilin-type processing-associated H-X9-DG protein